MIEEPKRQERFGLTNIGNTCYMNASIQFLRSVPAIDKLIRNAKLSNNNSKEQAIVLTLSSAIKEMDTKDSVPKVFVGLFLNQHP